MNPLPAPVHAALRAAASLMLSAALLASCSVYLPTHHASNETKPALFEWHGDGMEGTPSVKIHLHEQKAYIFLNGQEAGWTTLASGTSTHPTPNGSFAVMEKLVDKVSSTYGIIVNGAGE